MSPESCSSQITPPPPAAKSPAALIAEADSALLSPLIELLSELGELRSHLWGCSIEPTFRSFVALGIGHIAATAAIAVCAAVLPVAAIGVLLLRVVPEPCDR